MTTNITPETHIVFCSAVGDANLLHLNVHLRTQGVDARLDQDSRLGQVVKVPPADRAHAQELLEAWTLNPTDWRDDWAKLRAIHGDDDD